MYKPLLSFSQDIPKDLYREIRFRLTEGLECKELLEVTNREVKRRDTIILIKDSLMFTKDSLNDTLKKTASLAIGENNELRKSNKELKEEKKQTEKELKRSKITGIIKTGVIAVLATLTIILTI